MGTPPPALVFWAELLGIEVGDGIRLGAIAPHGTVFAEHTRTLEKRQVRRFEYAGMKRRGGSCPQGAIAVTCLSRARMTAGRSTS